MHHVPKQLKQYALDDIVQSGDDDAVELTDLYVLAPLARNDDDPKAVIFWTSCRIQLLSNPDNQWTSLNRKYQQLLERFAWLPKKSAENLLTPHPALRKQENNYAKQLHNLLNEARDFYKKEQLSLKPDEEKNERSSSAQTLLRNITALKERFDAYKTGPVMVNLPASLSENTTPEHRLTKHFTSIKSWLMTGCCCLANKKRMVSPTPENEGFLQNDYSKTQPIRPISHLMG